MILVTTGFHNVPFDRLVEWVDQIAQTGQFPESFFIQKGSSAVECEACESVDFLEMETMEQYMAECKAVITHGGTGSVMTALMSGKKPIVVPRLERYGEVCNDHQLEIAQVFAEKGWVYPATNKEEIAEHLSREIGSGRRHEYLRNNERLLSIVSSYLDEVQSRQAARRGRIGSSVSQ